MTPVLSPVCALFVRVCRLCFVSFLWRRLPQCRLCKTNEACRHSTCMLAPHLRPGGRSMHSGGLRVGVRDIAQEGHQGPAPQMARRASHCNRNEVQAWIQRDAWQGRIDGKSEGGGGGGVPVKKRARGGGRQWAPHLAKLNTGTRMRCRKSTTRDWSTRSTGHLWIHPQQCPPR